MPSDSICRPLTRILIAAVCAGATLMPGALFAQPPLEPGLDEAVFTSSVEAPLATAGNSFVGGDERSEPTPGWTKRETATGGWAGLRRRASEAGFSFGMSQLLDLSTIRDGKAANSNLGRGLFDVNLLVDLGKLVSLRGGTVFVQYYRKDGVNGSAYVGDVQGFSNIDAPPFRRTGEFWYEQTLGECLRLKIGRVDANSEFAYVDNGKEFFNSSMGFSPTIFTLPTYPTPSMSINVFVHPVSHISIAAGIYDGDKPDSSQPFRWSSRFLISEIDTTWAPHRGARPGRIGVGVWHHDGDFARLDDGSRVKGAAGIFMVADQTLWAGPADATGRRRTIATFLQYGRADGRESEISRHTGAGVTIAGLLPKRGGDLLGIGITSVRASALLRPLDGPRREVTVGGYYKIGITPWLSLKPDIQLIRSPGFRPTTARVVIASVRLGISY